MTNHNTIDYIFDQLKEQGRKAKLTIEEGIGIEAITIPNPRHVIFENRGTCLRPQWDRIVKEEGWEPLKIYFVEQDDYLAEIVQSATEKYRGLKIESQPEF